MLGFSVFLHVSSMDFYTADTAGFSDTMTLFAHNVFRYTFSNKEFYASAGYICRQH